MCGPNGVETSHAASVQNMFIHNKFQDAACDVSTECADIRNEYMSAISNMQGWLSVAIGGMKSAVTRFSHENVIPFAWQSRFHDHFIRNHEDMNRIADYITCNVQHWDEDCFYG